MNDISLQDCQDPALVGLHKSGNSIRISGWRLARISLQILQRGGSKQHGYGARDERPHKRAAMM
jgi:hypothetical protein